MARTSMVSLGRRGGLRGGPARAASLLPQRRREIAREAARRRWHRPAETPSVPRGPAELASFVAHHGSSVAPGSATFPLEGIVVAAVRASKGDPALARMLPVFLWRVREGLDLTILLRKARQPASGRALGFFLQVAAKLGRTRVFDQAIAALRSSYAAPARPIYFFHGTKARPFEKMVTDSRTPTEARLWGLLMNMPWDSFTSYFRKAAPL